MDKLHWTIHFNLGNTAKFFFSSSKLAWFMQGQGGQDREALQWVTKTTSHLYPLVPISLK